MDTQHIKIDETYLLPVTVTAIETNGWLSVATGGGYGYSLAPSEVETLLQNGTKNTEPAPKYDPCRKFRKGDKAKPRIINGRENQKIPANVIFTVIGDEDEYGAVPVEYMSPALGLPTSATVHAVWLELLAPAEDVEPYSIKYIDDKGEIGDRMEWRVVRSNCCVETFPCGSAGYYSYKQAKARAEQECARLNTEWRKEQE